MRILEAKTLAIKLKETAKAKIEALGAGVPHIYILCIGDDEASKWYNNSIEKICLKLGIKCSIIRHKALKQYEAMRIVRKLSDDKSVHGILINQPLPKHLSVITDEIAFEKDIEGVSSSSLGKLVLSQKTHIPCTPLAVIALLKHYKIELKGKLVCMIGRSAIVGKPLSLLLTKEDATLVLCHSKTKNIEKESARADILIAAIGKPCFIKKDWVKEGAVVIDVGTNYTKQGLVGDVDFADIKERASMISPVPGGVGSLTNLMLVFNSIDAFEQSQTMTNSL